MLTPAGVLSRGLAFAGYSQQEQERMTHSNLVKEFRSHFGSSPLDISLIWYDIQMTVHGEPLNNAERGCKGFKMFMVAMFFLWCHPKNASLTASRFKIGKRYLHSNVFWKWIYKISALKEQKIVWDERFNAEDYKIFILSIDGVDFDIWEKPTERYNMDRGLCSFKSAHGALRYLIGLSIWDSSCVFVHGPVKPGEVNDLDHWRLALKDRMVQLPGKLTVADKGYQTSEPDEVGLFSIPNPRDPAELHEFKVRVRQRHETFNGRMKKFKILQDTFRFPLAKHKHVFQSVCVIVQYQMESGSPLFDV